MEYGFYEFCDKNSYTGSITVLSFGVEIRVRKGDYGASCSISKDELINTADRDKVFNRAFEHLKRMIDNAKV